MSTDDDLIRTLCVSPPRSGHHLLTNYLFKYFSGDPHFRDIAGHETKRQAKDVVVAGRLHYCEHYHHCRRIPCVDPRVNLTKFHDRARSRGGDRFAHVIVQLRNPLLSIRSFYAFRHRRPPQDSNEFLDMLRPELAYWTRFVEKWILTPHSSRLVLSYDELIANPVSTVARAIRFLQPGAAVDDALLERCVAAQRVVRSNWFGEQRAIWDDTRLAALEDQIAPVLELAGIKRLFRAQSMVEAAIRRTVSATERRSPTLRNQTVTRTPGSMAPGSPS